MIIKNGKVFIDGEYHDYDIRVGGGKIVEIGKDLKFEDDIYDAKGKYVFPGFIDTHFHGALQHDCGDTVEAMKEICAYLPSLGTTSFVPTVQDPTDPNRTEIIAGLCRNVRKAKGAPGADILGIFMYTGYKNRHIDYYKPGVEPTVERTLALADGSMDMILSCLIAPELPGGLEHISWLVSQGVMPVIGFSEASDEIIAEAVARGARVTDHFPNGFPLMDHHVGMSTTQCLIEDELYMQLNPDCIHVAPNYMEMMFRAKGEDKFVAVSDSTQLMGLPEGKYFFAGKDVFIKDGAVRDSFGKLVTGCHPFDENMRTFRAHGFSMETVGKIFTENAAKAFKLMDRGKMEVGRRADITVMSEDLYVEKTMVKGTWCYSKGEKI